MFPLHNKVSHKNHTHFRRSLNLCERTEECLFNNKILNMKGFKDHRLMI